jgi:hypothetical protein
MQPRYIHESNSLGIGLIESHTTIFRDASEANELAMKLNKDEATEYEKWSYQVESYKGGYVVAIYDEDDIFVGNL